MSADARSFGLTTSSMRLRYGTVVVRHGRRTTSDTATILLHGAAGSWSTWTPLLSAADVRFPGSLADLIIPDLPGFGDTRVPTDAEPPTIAATAALVAEIALALGYRRWRLVGHSLGGFLALDLAATTPESTASVGLVSATTYSVIDSVRHPLTRFGVLPGYTALLAVMRVLARFGAAGCRFVAFLDRVSLLGALTAPLFRRPAAVHRSVIAALAAEVRPQAFAAASALAGAYDADRSWSRIQCPVRSIHGDSDVFVADSDDAFLRRAIVDFTARTIAGTGHFGQIEKPYETLDALLPHLADLPLR